MILQKYLSIYKIYLTVNNQRDFKYDNEKFLYKDNDVQTSLLHLVMNIHAMAILIATISTWGHKICMGENELIGFVGVIMSVHFLCHQSLKLDLIRIWEDSTSQ